MKIIHTADWHIGKQLYNISLSEDFEHFVSFMIEYILKENVYAVLVSGDIFDSSVPGNAARKQYYQTLNQLLKTGVRVIITAGNHDSVTQIEAPKDLLEQLNVFVTGDAKSVKPLVLEDVVILPVPFLYDRDIRKLMEGMGEQDRVEAVKKGITDYYVNWSEEVKIMFPSKSTIAMGHLFMQGVKESDSERDIQVGKQAAIKVDSFEGLFDYFALGHIHKPQKITESIRYSGSPIPLSFSEREDRKGFVLLEIQTDKIASEFIHIPKYRELIKVKGSLNYVQQKLQEIDLKTDSLPVLADVEIMEEREDPGLRLLANDWLNRYKSEHCQIASYKIIFSEENFSTKNLMSSSRSIEEMNPRNVFIQKMEDEVNDSNDQILLLEAFDELYDEMLQP